MSEKKPPPNAQVVEIVGKLEELLAYAKLGEVQALAYVAVSDAHAVRQGKVEQEAFSRDLSVGVADMFFAHYAERDVRYTNEDAPA